VNTTLTYPSSLSSPRLLRSPARERHRGSSFPTGAVPGVVRAEGPTPDAVDGVDDAHVIRLARPSLHRTRPTSFLAIIVASLGCPPTQNSVMAAMVWIRQSGAASASPHTTPLRGWVCVRPSDTVEMR